VKHSDANKRNKSNSLLLCRKISNWSVMILIFGVYILLRAWDQVMGVFISVYATSRCITWSVMICLHLVLTAWISKILLNISKLLVANVIRGNRHTVASSSICYPLHLSLSLSYTHTHTHTHLSWFYTVSSPEGILCYCWSSCPPCPEIRSSLASGNTGDLTNIYWDATPYRLIDILSVSVVQGWSTYNA
jgi:hypothetical protein